MEENNGKKRRGGSRPGAGRKPTGHGKYYGFNSTPETERVLESLPGDRTRFINEAIADFARRRGICSADA